MECAALAELSVPGESKINLDVFNAEVAEYAEERSEIEPRRKQRAERRKGG
jgi:hypothetical protein